MAEKSPLQPKSLVQTIVALSKTLQFYWFLGNLGVLVNFIFNILSFGKSVKYYNRTLLSILFTYSIVIKQVHFKFKLVQSISKLSNREFRLKLIRDENVQYFLLATTYYLSSSIIGPISGALYSFAIFSFFHVLIYVQNNLLHAFPISISKQQQINSAINSFATQYNQQALLLASNSELLAVAGFGVSIPLVLITIFRNPFAAIVKALVFVVLVVFFKLRYNTSKFAQTVVEQWDMKINSLLLNPMCPSSIRDLYNVTFKGLVKSYVSPIELPKLKTK